MKKLLASIFLLVGFSLVLFSQEENNNNTLTSTNHQIGFNMGSLVKALTNKEDESIFQETFSYKYLKNKSALRFGLGGQYQKEITDNNNNSQFDQRSFSVRLGFEKQKHVSDKWQYYFGWDLKFNAFNKNNPNSFSSRVKSKTFSVSPLLGFQFRLTPHLFLQSEASINFFYSESDFTNLDDVFFPTPFENNSDSKTRGVDITLPNILNLVVEF